MLIKSTHFSIGHPLSPQKRLSDELLERKRKVIDKIKAVMSLKAMTDAFLTKLVNEALVLPLVIDYDKKRWNHRNEEIETRHGHDRAQVARLSIPFRGEAELLKYCPETWGTTFPMGEVHGNQIQFDVNISGGQNAEQVEAEIKQNCGQIRMAAESINQQVQAFNDSLFVAVKEAFAAKFEELKKQHSIFDDLGIEDDEDLVDKPVAGVAPSPRQKKKVRDPAYVIQYVHNQFIAQLNQINQNNGDVNNAIQSS